MVYVFIEGETNKSEQLFWKFLSETVFKSITTIYACGGTSELVKMVRKELPQLHQLCNSDNYERDVLICYDTTALEDYFGSLKRRCEYLKSIYESSKLHINIVDYYCFEDCLLLFPDLKCWLYSKTLRTQRCDKIELLLQYTDLGTSLDWKSTYELKTFVINYYKYQKKLNRALGLNERQPIEKRQTKKEIENKLIERTSRECVAGYLLEHLTQDTHFEVSKGHLSDCWCNSCLIQSTCDTHKEIQANGTDPKECGLYVSNKLTESQKANELISKSPMLADIANKYPWLYS